MEFAPLLTRRDVPFEKKIRYTAVVRVPPRGTATVVKGYGNGKERL